MIKTRRCPKRDASCPTRSQSCVTVSTLLPCLATLSRRRLPWPARPHRGPSPSLHSVCRVSVHSTVTLPHSRFTGPPSLPQARTPLSACAPLHHRARGVPRRSLRQITLVERMSNVFLPLQGSPGTPLMAWRKIIALPTLLKTGGPVQVKMVSRYRLRWKAHGLLMIQVRLLHFLPFQSKHHAAHIVSEITHSDINDSSFISTEEGSPRFLYLLRLS